MSPISSRIILKSLEVEGELLGFKKVRGRGKKQFKKINDQTEASIFWLARKIYKNTRMEVYFSIYNLLLHEELSKRPLRFTKSTSLCTIRLPVHSVSVDVPYDAGEEECQLLVREFAATVPTECYPMMYRCDSLEKALHVLELERKRLIKEQLIVSDLRELIPRIRGLLGLPPEE